MKADVSNKVSSIDSIFTIRCTNCGGMFEDDYDLANDLFDTENDEYHDGCPKCKTDIHLMDIDPISKSELIQNGGYSFVDGRPFLL